MASTTGFDASWLTEHIRSNIPLAETMQFTVVELDADSITVAAPLAPNINIHGTGFAGSLYSLAVLTAWGYTNALVNALGISADVVVKKAQISYRLPVQSDISCHCISAPTDRAAFLENLQANGRGRMSLSVNIGSADEALPKAQLKAQMVAVRRG